MRRRASDEMSPQSSPLSSPADFSPENSDWGSFFEEEVSVSPEPQYSADPTHWQPPTGPNALLPSLEVKRRGRKPNRPFDPVRKKTEEKDKYWLRAFRAYMKTHFGKIRKTMKAEERFFWRDYLGPEGKPEKGNRYSSFGRQYKTALFSNPSFVQHFQDWFLNFGEEELLKKCPRQSPLWFVFFDYASKELFNYNPNSPSPPQDSGSVSPATPSTPEAKDVPLEDNFVITMVEDDPPADMEMYLEEI